MNLDKTIKIKCEAKVYADLKDLNHFQGDLKSITKDDLFKLKQSLILDGLPLAMSVWIDKNGKYQLIDGHHRRYALLELEKEGYFIPPLPCVIVNAQNKKEAAKQVLINNSKYATLSQESFSNFMIEMDLQLPEIENLKIPELKNLIENFDDLGFDPTDDDDNKDGKKTKTCPHCGEII